MQVVKAINYVFCPFGGTRTLTPLPQEQILSLQRTTNFATKGFVVGRGIEPLLQE